MPFPGNTRLHNHLLWTGYYNFCYIIRSDRKPNDRRVYGKDRTVSNKDCEIKEQRKEYFKELFNVKAESSQESSDEFQNYENKEVENITLEKENGTKGG